MSHREEKNVPPPKMYMCSIQLTHRVPKLPKLALWVAQKPDKSSDRLGHFAEIQTIFLGTVQQQIAEFFNFCK